MQGINVVLVALDVRYIRYLSVAQFSAALSGTALWQTDALPVPPRREIRNTSAPALSRPPLAPRTPAPWPPSARAVPSLSQHRHSPSPDRRLTSLWPPAFAYPRMYPRISAGAPPREHLPGA